MIVEEDWVQGRGSAHRCCLDEDGPTYSPMISSRCVEHGISGTICSWMIGASVGVVGGTDLCNERCEAEVDGSMR